MDMVGKSIQVEYSLDEILKKINAGWDTAEAADRELQDRVSPAVEWGRNAFNFYHTCVQEQLEALHKENERLRSEHNDLMEHLANYGKASNPSNSDPALVMVVSLDDSPMSTDLICEDLYGLDHALDSIFLGGDPSGNFEDYWDEGSGVNIRFERMSRKAIEEAGHGWESFIS